MAKSLARTFGQDLMCGEHVFGAEKTNGGVLMPSHSSGDPSFYAKKRAKEAELGHELTTEAFGCVSKLVEILWRRSPSMLMWT